MNQEKFDKIWKSVPRIEQNPQELFDLINVIETIKPELALEIGVLNGGTLKFWEQVLPVGGLLIGLDHWEHSRDWDFGKSDRKIVMVKKFSQEASALDKVKEILQGEELDFVFIDADHHYKQVLNDYQKYGSLVRKGGLVIFSDVYDLLGGVSKVAFSPSIRGKRLIIRYGGVGHVVWWKQ